MTPIEPSTNLLTNLHSTYELIHDKKTIALMNIQPSQDCDLTPFQKYHLNLIYIDLLKSSQISINIYPILEQFIIEYLKTVFSSSRCYGSVFQCRFYWDSCPPMLFMIKVYCCAHQMQNFCVGTFTVACVI